MIGLSALAFTPPELPKTRDEISSVSQKIERTISECDRSTETSLKKKEVKAIQEIIYAVTDKMSKKNNEGNAILTTLLYGTASEIESLGMDDVIADEVLSTVEQINNGISRLKYAFFVASTSPAWAPHMATLKHLEKRTIDVYTEYAELVSEISDIAQEFMSDSDFSYDLDSAQSSLKSETVAHPDWVKDGDDFVNWINQLQV